MIKTLTHPETGKIVRLGRTRPRVQGPRLSLRNYLLRATATTPTPPATVNYATHFPTPIALGEMYLNDQLGDCVVACMGHVEGVVNGNVGVEAVYTSEQITQLYSAIGGYVPGDPSTDNGCDEQTALNYWQSKGTQAGHKIAGYLAVNPADVTELHTAIWLFENLVYGMELPDAWVNPFPSAPGFTWDVAGDPDPNNGHCIAGVGYDAGAIMISTWGMVGNITNAATTKYCAGAVNGELYTVVTADSLRRATGKAPTGFDWTQLVADFEALGGSL